MSNQKLNAGDVFKWLQDNGFVDVNTGTLTSTFFDSIRQNKSLDEMMPVPVKAVNLLPTKKEDWQRKFIDFIMEAKVPTRWETSSGETYYLNKFSEAGLKVFKKALESGALYEVLVKSTMLYYKSSTRFKKTIGNYFSQGDWKTDYEALLQSAGQGIEALEQHVKDELNTNVNRTQYKIG